MAQPINPHWLNEKLIYLRVAWGRATFSDILFDVEKRELIFREQAIYGDSAYQQFRQQCQGRCPSDASGVTGPSIQPQTATGLMPSSQPGENALIGILKLPTIFGPGESEPPANPTPVPVYASREAGAKKLGEPSDAQAFKSKKWGYEAPGAVVYAKRPGWYQIGLADGAKVWLSAKSPSEPGVVDSGWIPAYAKNGALVADYYSRGC